MNTLDSFPERARDELIYERVFDAILEQRLAPGTRLSEDKLGQVFGVSRTIIRQVLQRLEHEGVVEIHRNRGASVARTSADQTRQAFAARQVVERAIVLSACEHLQPEAVQVLHAIIQAEQAALQANDRGRALRLSGELHLKLAELCGNEFLAHFARTMVSRCSLIIAQYEAHAHELCSIEEHTEIIHAIADKNSELAVRLMVEHIQHIEAKLVLSEAPANQDLAAIFAEELKIT
ncbi:MAG: GntR family transcriptional regulator [Thiolinea sp.]